MNTIIHDFRTWLSAWLLGWSFAEADLLVRILFGLPGAIYISLKIYHEFIKKNKATGNEKS
jgi:hypothetical protein